MSTISGVNSTADLSASITTASEKQVTSADFMKLLIAQLQNQDPTSPVDNQAFVTQLATFNSLEQLVSINNGVAQLADRADISSSSLEQLVSINNNIAKLADTTDSTAETESTDTSSSSL